MKLEEINETEKNKYDMIHVAIRRNRTRTTSTRDPFQQITAPSDSYHLSQNCPTHNILTSNSGRRNSRLLIFLIKRLYQLPTSKLPRSPKNIYSGIYAEKVK